ncbi:ABC transporter ATP-binding protein [Sulfurimonas sp.]|uniref:ABC transporter ATP-binding protein n=1 Tax=Sulfurimonas sp. TaxID=2022749 RepID=UPI0026057C30|nr:ABC transporter ATP-binding protein [Sulfurimonas sp.]
MIELKNLSCSFEDKRVLQNISLTIAQHLCILGANGSGKSTLAKALCGLVTYEGDIFLDERSINSFSLIEKAKAIAYIPAKLEIYDAHISVQDFILLGRFAYKKSFFEYAHKDVEMVKETLEFLNISRLKHNLLNELSSGEQQLVLIAQALVQQSQIIIFDEPTANLDPKNSKIIAQHIKELKKNHNIILITHDLHFAAYIDSPVAFIQEHALHYYEDDFFTDTRLEELYGVSFDGLAVQYD